MGLTVFSDPQQQTFQWDVAVYRATTGRHDEFRFQATFRRMTTDEQQSFEAGKTDVRALMREHLVGWDGLQDESGNPLPFNDETRELVLNDPDILIGLGRALGEAGRGWRAERKN